MSVKLTWPNGDTNMVDQDTIERYRALYGEYPKQCKMEKAERAAQLAAIADKVYAASEPLTQEQKDDIRHGIGWTENKLSGVKHVRGEAWTVRMGDNVPNHNDGPIVDEREQPCYDDPDYGLTENDGNPLDGETGGFPADGMDY